MNRWGERKIPFVFIVDFEMKKPLLFSLEQLSDKDILYDFNGIRNFDQSNYENTNPCNFKKFPLSYSDYLLKFNYIQEQIQLGNTYLINLTCATPIESDISLREIFYSAAAKYKIWFKDQWVCFSPETFITIRDGVISTFPMKGTIDASLADAEKVILEDKKEIAEHYTIVDLMRNDLNMVADEVGVVSFRYIDRIKTNNKELLQVSSAIRGKLKDDYLSRLGDIVFALLPAGSVSGAPKKKTVDIIIETEGFQRGYYTGISGIFDGKNLDTCVLIRFIEQDHKGLIYKSGGGITSLSDSYKEYVEMIDKVYVPVI